MVLNFSDKEQSATFNENIQHGDYVEWFSKEKKSFGEKTSDTIAPFGYKVYVKVK